MIRSFTVIITSCFIAWGTAVADTPWHCPDGEFARAAFETGEAQSWSNYSVADGGRVQRQYPKTRLTAQSKFIDWNNSTFGICQYYSHIGLVYQFGGLRLQKAEITGEAYWRTEYVSSSEDLDKEGHEMMDVCMEDENGVAAPSIACGFLIPE